MDDTGALAIKLVMDAFGWVIVIIGGIVGWAVKEGFSRRLGDIEKSQSVLSDRLITMERLIASTVTHVELARSIDALRAELTATRAEITATRLELKSDFQAAAEMFTK